MKKSKIDEFVKELIKEISFEKVLKENLETLPDGDYYLLGLGKASFQMGKIGKEVLKEKLKSGLIITKYDHSEEEIKDVDIIESSHPIPDENSILAGKKAINFIKSIPEDGNLLFLLSGGGSSLMEYPMDKVTLEDIKKINKKLISSGGNIDEINTVRKHLSKVKGGRLSKYFQGKMIYSFIISDVLGDRVDSIASGPLTKDYSTSKEALDILEKYNIQVSDNIKRVINKETIKDIPNLNEKIIQNIDTLINSAIKILKNKGYNTYVISNSIKDEAKVFGEKLGKLGKSIIKDKNKFKTPTAFVSGGETVVKVKGNGKGGRNTELALSALIELKGEEKISVLSFASDGTDGPTDSAGGFINCESYKKARKLNINLERELENNNSYFVLEKIDSLIKTGPTGNNLNDLYILFIE